MNDHRARKVEAFFDRPDTYRSYRYGIRLRAEIIKDLVGDSAVGRSLLDIGCGDGSLSVQFLPEAERLTLIDLSAQMLAAAEARIPAAYSGHVDLIQSDMLSYDPGSRFDLVLCVGVLAHVESVGQALEKIAALLKPGGRCILQYTDQSSLLARLKFRLHERAERTRPHYAYAVNRIWKNELHTLAHQYGLEPQAERRYSLMLPGFGRLPDRLLYRFQRFTLDLTLLSKFGTDVIVIMQKRDGVVP